MVHTRKRTHVRTDGHQNQESNEDDIPGQLPSKSEIQTGDSSRSFRSENSERMKGTPSSAQSPVLGLHKSAKSSVKKNQFMFDLSAEDTPLSVRQSNSGSKKGKRLKLYQGENDSRELQCEEGSSTEFEDSHEKPKRRTRFCEGSESEKQDESGEGIRRSTRKRKLVYGPCNTSWILGGQTARGYPTFEEDDEEEEGKRRSLRIRTRKRDDVTEDAGEEDSDGQEQADRNGSIQSKEQSDGVAEDGCPVKKESKSYSDDMYSRVKRLRRAPSHYTSYRTTISNVKRTRNGKRSRRSFVMTSDESSRESGSESANEEASGERLPNRTRRTRGTKHENTEERNENNSDNQPIDGKRVKGKYLLRRIQPVTNRYQPMDEKQRCRTPPRSRSNHRVTRMMCSPAHRAFGKRRQKAQNESSDSSSSSDEGRFERMKNKSMVKARNRCRPMNLSQEDLAQGGAKDRTKSGSSLADVDPMKIDRNVSFDMVGGLDTYIRSLKEMILFPLLYPEVFQRFSIQPPRGVLFYGPPGTGKTLVARCLANECSQKDRRVAFFMRKGADCLSKWVGESERQLRLLFDQAYQMRPSIIFFDEIDGLAPVRSSRQDQIHSSIVSTLLALMDGLDSRGEVIIIGATNRLDAIDPALRRPGRFDREFHFPLPSLPARKEILGIHLKSWNPSPAASLVNFLSEKTVGYCGADLKALCAEAALLALRRRYPQVYNSKDKLLLDMSQINVGRRDFMQAVQRLVPASQRGCSPAGKPLSATVLPLLENSFQLLIQQTQRIFPHGMSILKLKGPLSGAKKQTSNHFSSRLLVVGDCCNYLGSALLHHMERLPVHRLDLTTLYGLTARNPEEACVQVFQEARRNVPAVIYLPLISRWWPATSDTVRATFMSLLSELDSELPILLLATHDSSLELFPDELSDLFYEEDGEIFHTNPFSEQERRKFFSPLLLHKCLKPPLARRNVKSEQEALPLAPPPPPKQLNEAEKAKVERKEEATLRELRIFLREILAKIARNKLFYMFTRPVDVEEVPDYLDIIQQPMDVETMMTKIDRYAYESAKDFLSDIELICSNALEYNPDRDAKDKMIRHRACTLRDTAYALIKAEMDTDFEELCQEISRTRKAREEIPEIPEVPLPVPSPKPLKSSEPKPLPVQPEIKSVIKENGIKTESETPNPIIKKKTMKRTSWSRGVVGKRPAKKGKIEVVPVNSNVSVSANENGSAAENDSLSTLMSITDDNPVDSSAVDPDTPDLATDVGDHNHQTNDTASICPMDETIGELDESVLNESILDVSIMTEATDITKEPTVSNEFRKIVVIDIIHLEQLLNTIVQKTKDYEFVKLLRLHCKLVRIVDRFMKLWDRSSLIQELEITISRIAEVE